MLAGYGTSDLTPPVGTELCGYGYYLDRRADEIHDPLFARALYLEDGSGSYLIVSCDLLGLSREIVRKVKDGLAQEGFDPDHLMLVSIHTHTGPAMIYHEGCGYTDPDCVARVPSIILKACRAAMIDRSEVTQLTSGMGEVADGLIYNRSDPDGFLDRSVRSLFLSRSGGKPIALVSLGCHPVCSGRARYVSADYPGVVVHGLESLGYHGIFLNGLCGDVDPVRDETRDGDFYRQRLGRAIVEQAGKNLRVLPLTLCAGWIPFTLHLSEVSREDIRKSADRAVLSAGHPQDGAARVARIWETEMLAKYDQLRFEEPISIPYLFLGGNLIIALPFEGFGAIGRIIRGRINAQDAMVLGCAEELLGYLPTLDDIARGAYAALESTYLYKRLPVKPGEAERLGEVVGRLVSES